MKPITNILLVLSLVCYVFLPFYEISFQGSLTGFSFTAGSISQHPTILHTVYALLPFIACFAAIAVNTMHNRWWGLASLACILLALFFFHNSANFHDISLAHQPDVIPTDDIGEGFSIIGLGIGFRLSCAFAIAALVTTILSMLPFKFNERIERAVDESLDRGLEDMRALGTRMTGERRQRKTPGRPEQTDDATPPTTPTPPEIPTDPNDHSRFMPK